MGPPWASGLGTLGVLAILAFMAFSMTPIIAAIGAVLVLVALAVILTAKREDAKRPTPPDAVTGGPRWWQKRWDE